MLLGRTDLDVFPLGLGGNVFGGNASAEESFAVLDAYVEAGGNFIDLADVYVGGVAEEVVGAWLARRGRRADLVIATKVGKADGLRGLAPTTIRRALEASLARLGIETVDLYYAHEEDPAVPIAESLGAFGELRDEGKLRYAAASNFTAAGLREALAAEGVPRFEVLQPEYNLMERGYERELRDACAAADVSCVPYFSLASGFLTGRYRPGQAAAPHDRRRSDERRTRRATRYLDDPRGPAVLAALGEIAASHGVPVAAVAIAWLLAQPTVASALASARTPAQLADLLPSARLRLGADELGRLDAASRGL
jgi:aryl-alcohol dehydrogenase-like predicted oxidoreductase